MKVFGQFGHRIESLCVHVLSYTDGVYQTLHATDTTESFLANSGHRPESLEILAELWPDGA
jgi:hypothetical protein